jgi:2-methylisocitrate lyase-like PEP mutase family enzyme
MAEATARIRAFDAAGADGLYVPIPPSFEDLEALCAMTDKPVNALAAGPFASYTRADFARIGVARISLGSALARTAHRAFIDAFTEITEDGSFAMLKKTVSGDRVDAMLRQYMG